MRHSALIPEGPWCFVTLVSNVKAWRLKLDPSARTVSVSMGVARRQAHRCTLKERQTVAKSLRLSAGDCRGCLKKQKQVGKGFIP